MDSNFNKFCDKFDDLKLINTKTTDVTIAADFNIDLFKNDRITIFYKAMVWQH